MPDVRSVALTTDIGEGFGIWKLGPDEELLEIVTAANIACGFHGGDPSIMRRTCEIAARNGVAIGAQVSYRDMAGFGRRFIDVPTDVLVDDLVYQIGALTGFARIAGSSVSFVRAHGALQNAAATHVGQATAFVTAVKQFDSTLAIVCQANTEPWRQAKEAGLRVVTEEFADRAYTSDGLLLTRAHPEALITDPDRAAARAVRMVTEGKLDAIDGSDIEVEVDTLLCHSDTPGAVAIAQAVRDALSAAGIELRRQL